MNLASKKLGLFVAILTSCVAVSALSGCSSNVNEEPQAEGTSDLTSTGQLSGSGMAAGTYALTFDDGPGARTEELANWLGDRGIAATFFINGRNAPGHDAALAAITSRGHTLANHTQNHEDMRQQAGGVLYHAVADTDDVIARYQPQGPWLLRAPYGAWNGRVSEELNDSDMKKYVGSIFWDIGGELTATTAADWACWGEGVGVDDCAGRYMNEMGLRGSGVSLMHDIHSKTVDMVKIIVERMGASHFVGILNAPEIASAVGTVPPRPINNGGGVTPPPPPPPPSPPPAAGGGCGTVDYKGFCEKNKLTWCKDGVLATVDCESTSTVCSWKSNEDGHDCVAKTACGDATYAGSCNGEMLTWCDEAGALRQINCAARGNHCALQDEATGFNCLAQ